MALCQTRGVTIHSDLSDRQTCVSSTERILQMPSRNTEIMFFHVKPEREKRESESLKEEAP